MLILLPFLLSRSIRKNWKAAYLAACMGMLMHGPLDALTSYGTLLYWPFSQSRAQWDILPIIDPLVTVPLLSLLIFAAVRSWRSTLKPAPEADESIRSSRRWCVAALAFLVAYCGLAVLQRERARSVVQSLAQSRSHVPERMRLMPQPASITLWRSIYAHGNQVQADLVRTPILGPATVRVGASTIVLSPADALQTARAAGLPEGSPAETDVLRTLQRFDWFTDHWMVRDPDDPLLIGDGRYAPLPENFRTLWALQLPSPQRPMWGFRMNRQLRTLIVPELLDGLLGRDARFQVAPDPAAVP